MNVLVVLAHPDPRSLNHAIARAVTDTLRGNGHEVVFHDLCEERFDPFLPASEIAREADLQPELARHCRELMAADGVVIVHPNWWGQPPAVMIGWVDRIFRPGVAYEFLDGDAGEGVPVGLLKAGIALVFNTSNTSADRELNVFGDPLERIWRDCIFGLCGVPKVYRRMFRVVVTSSSEQRRQWLDEARETVDKHFPREARQVQADESKLDCHADQERTGAEDPGS